MKSIKSSCSLYQNICIYKHNEHIKIPETSSKCGKRNPEGVGFTITGNNDNEAEYGGNIIKYIFFSYEKIILVDNVSKFYD